MSKLSTQLPALFVTLTGVLLPTPGCKNDEVQCGPGTTLQVLPDGSAGCMPDQQQQQCPDGFSESTWEGQRVCADAQGNYHCEFLSCGTVSQGSAATVASMRKVATNNTVCTCVPASCVSGYTLQGATCVQDVRGERCGPEPEIPYACADGHFPCDCVDNAGAWAWNCHACEGTGGNPPALDCNATPNDVRCAKDRACINCHGLSTGPGSAGIENPHPWLYVACVDCHGGVGLDAANPTRNLSKEEAHVALPAAMREGTNGSLPKRTVYANNYLGKGGVESLAGGPEWLRFSNPSDLRVVDNTCAKSTCHAGAGEVVRKSTMSTLVGKYDAMLAVTGVPRDAPYAAMLGNDSYGKNLATVGAVDVTDSTWSRNTSPPGSVPGLKALKTFDREHERPFGTYSEMDLQRETVNKLCGDCHLNNNGSNDKYAQFRSSGCSACHMVYDWSGKSQSTDPMINKNEPTYPQAFDQIQYPERPHPIRHQISRIPNGQQCLPCHTGSARSVLQYWGIRVDDNRDLTRTNANGGNLNFRTAKNLVDNTRNAQARLRGFTEDQLIEFEDLDDDGQDDTPPDVHYEAKMDCIDCHTSPEMHGDGKIYSRQSSATKIYCTSCHGTLEYPVEPDDPSNPINVLYQVGQRASRKVLWKFDQVPGYGQDGYPYVTQPGVWLRTRSRNEWKYVFQIAWGVKWDPNQQNCFGEGAQIDPRNGGQLCNEISSIAHGRWNGLSENAGDFEDGVGPRPNNEVVAAADGTNNPMFGFSHLGAPTTRPNEIPAGGLQCTSCHGHWQAMRYGNHLGLIDTDGAQRFYEWDRVTGQVTLGKQQFFNFTFVSNLDLQLAVNSKGRLAWFLPARLKLFVRQTVLRNNAPFEFMTQAGDADFNWKTYRDRVGRGNLIQGSQSGIDNAPGYSEICVEQGYCDTDPKKNINGALGIDQMEPHTVRTRTRDCTSCHYDANGAGAHVAAVYGWDPNGYTKQTSAYLNKVPQVQAHGSTYDTNNGFLIADDGIQHRLDHMVDQQTGYPLVGTIHVRTDDGREGRPARGYETYDPATAGPITKSLIDKLQRIRVNNIYND